MNWLFEQPGYAIAIGVIGICVFGFLWLQTSSSRWLVCAFSVVGISAAMVALERWVETDRERIHTSLHGLVDAIQHSDVDAVFALLHPQASSVRKDADYYLNRFKFQRVVIKPNLRIQLDRQADAAVAEFNVLLVVRLPSDSMPRRMTRFVRVWLREVNEVWLVERYQHSNAIDGVTRRRGKRF